MWFNGLTKDIMQRIVNWLMIKVRDELMNELIDEIIDALIYLIDKEIDR